MSKEKEILGLLPRTFSVLPKIYKRPPLQLACRELSLMNLREGSRQPAPPSPSSSSLSCLWMAARSDQHRPFSAPPANSLEPFVFCDPDLDLDVALSHWAQLPACDIDELYPPSPLSHNCQYTQVNYVQPQRPLSLTCTYTLPLPPAAATVAHIQCLPEHELGHITPPLHTPHADADVHNVAANADSTVIASDIMLAHQQHSADKFESSAPLLGGQCLSEYSNHMEDQLPLYPLIKPNGTSPYMGNSLALEDLNHLMKSGLPSLVPVSPTSGALSSRYNSATLESSAMMGSSFSAAMTSSSSTCYESQLLHLE